MSNKTKIFTISDHPLSPSGVGGQTKNMIEGMLKTGKYQFAWINFRHVTKVVCANLIFYDRRNLSNNKSG